MLNVSLFDGATAFVIRSFENLDIFLRELERVGVDPLSIQTSREVAESYLNCYSVPAIRPYVSRGDKKIIMCACANLRVYIAKGIKVVEFEETMQDGTCDFCESDMDISEFYNS